MFTIKHYGNYGYDVYEAVSYSISRHPDTPVGHEIAINYVAPAPEGETNQIKQIVIAGDGHAYISNSDGRTVDHVKPMMNIPTSNGYVTAA